MSLNAVCPHGHLLQLTSRQIDRYVVCPHCQTKFFAEEEMSDSERPAWVEEMMTFGAKARRPRDEEDEGVEDEKTRQKRLARKRKADEEEDEEDDEEEEARKARERRLAKKKKKEEDELFGELKLEKRLVRKKGKKYDQLGVCSNGLLLTQISTGTLEAVFVFYGILMIVGMLAPTVVLILALMLLPCLALTPILFFAGQIMNLWVPPKAEAQGMIMTAVGLNVVVFVLTGVILAIRFGNLVADPVTSGRFVGLLALFAVVSFYGSFMAFMSYLGQLCIFMGDNKLASQATLLGGFNLLCAIGMGIVQAGEWNYREMEISMGDWVRYAISFLSLVVNLAAARFNVLLILYIRDIRKVIYMKMHEEEEIFD